LEETHKSFKYPGLAMMPDDELGPLVNVAPALLLQVAMQSPRFWQTVQQL
jgi:hypothetical protein